MASRSLLGGVRVSSSCRWLLPKSAKRLAGRTVLLSRFLGEDRLRNISNAGVSSSSAAANRGYGGGPKGLRPVVVAQRREDGRFVDGAAVGSSNDVSRLSRRSFHLSSTRDSSSAERSAERTAVAQADFTVAAEEERQSVLGKSRVPGKTTKNSLFPYADEDDEYSEEDYSDDEDGEVVRVGGDSSEDDDELAISRLGIAAEIVDALVKREITHLFPIQRAVLTPAMEGRDLIGRAKTGTGKTLAFGIPIIDRIITENQGNRFARRSGRSPRALILAPTRELAKQVEREFMESAPSLSTICVYGGVSITAQQRQLQKGVDIAVGTPGRVIDLIDRQSLNLDEIQFLVLDEADQMLAVGFEEDVEKILETVPDERQSFLFSATMPAWVKKLSKKYLNNPLTIDLVGESDEKLAEKIKLMAVQIPASAKRSVLNDLIAVYAKGEKSIIFTQTKRDADEVSLSMSRTIGCEALHGDITQAQREKTLAAFREGRFSVLVATDVAARGLDIPNVDLIVHYEIPNDPETFVHRSGRTGRAGKAGTAILMFSSNQARTMKQIERDVGCRFEMVPPPSVEEVLMASSDQAKEVIKKVHPQLVETFLPTAEKLLDESGPRALAAAIAYMSGFSQPPTSRSLITYEEGITTLRIIRTNKARGSRLTSARAVMGTLADIYKSAADQVGKIKILDDPNVEGAVFDLPEDIAKELLQKPRDEGDIIDIPKSLPRIEEEDYRGRSDSYGRFSGGGGRSSRGGYGRGDRDDRRSSSRSGGRFEDRSRGGGYDDDWRGGGSSFRDSRGSDRGSRGGSFSGACYICNQPGHRASDCPKGRR
ncbi:unnamed protein product [Calypogeia fissa]